MIGIKKKSIKVLVACEESQAVTFELRKKGIEAYSNDIQPCSGGYPEWHLQCCVFDVLHEGWDAMIAFPPCTHLACSGAQWFEEKRKDGRQQEGIDFFMAMVNAPIDRIAIENPVGIMSKLYQRPTQIIQPYFFGDKVRKTTCLWLKGLPKLLHAPTTTLFDLQTHVEPEIRVYIGKDGKEKRFSGAYTKWFKNGEERSRERSKTFSGVARAMGEQWGNYLIDVCTV